MKICYSDEAIEFTFRDYYTLQRLMLIGMFVLTNVIRTLPSHMKFEIPSYADIFYNSLYFRLIGRLYYSFWQFVDQLYTSPLIHLVFKHTVWQGWIKWKVLIDSPQQGQRVCLLVMVFLLLVCVQEMSSNNTRQTSEYELV